MDASLADIAAVTRDNDGWGGGNGLWLFAILALMGGGFGGWNRTGDYGQFATAASQQEILFGQRFSELDNKMDRGFTSIGNGISDATYALNNAINTVGSKVDANKYEAALGFASVNANIDNKFAALERTQLEQRIADQAGQINQLQLQAALCNVVRYPNGYTYNAGNGPFCNCGGCGCGSI